MTFKQKWRRLPQWLQVTVYSVLGLAAMAGVGYLGFQLVGIVIGKERMNVFWGAAGAIVLIGIVFGGLGRRRDERHSRQNESAD